ncbi:hypothetical protein CYA_1425 [Synechococcus sp. JA-3-3Ab]|nr:hypothetical protein CYA_1425 [Synechococcus sp. JA-3-3Ab]
MVLSGSLKRCAPPAALTPSPSPSPSAPRR